jgi:hypothetical protein
VKFVVSRGCDIFDGNFIDKQIMKKLLLAISIISLLTACSTAVQYYQVYKVIPEQQPSATSGLTYEDENCTITYNLWANGGNPGLEFHNKTSQIVEIDLSKSFYILNGFSKAYFQNRTFVKNTSTGVIKSYTPSYRGMYMNFSTTAGMATNTTYGVETVEQPIIRVPPGVSVYIEEFTIVSERWKHCDMPKSPTMKKVVTKSFDKSNSPFTFGNRINYTIAGKSIDKEHNFYVSAITNYPRRGYLVKVTKTECGSPLMKPEYKFPNPEAAGFYLDYLVGN